ncbi:intercellular adhesion molecule 5 isoform X1 [Amia ocellicauda]|uniref:intercellular adhesion molecule 5 isoform X1 n=1 Tax=Amia ocellicauda TaxID=2972642 RepID=UPI003463931B
MSGITTVVIVWGMILSTGMTTAAAFCPIVIDPPTVVVKYGDPVSANCTVTRTTRGMGWEASVGSIDMQTDVQSLLWSVSSLTDWTAEPKCYANFQTEPKQCNQNLNIRLYKYPDSVSISSVGHTGPMEEGGQYRLQCDVQSIAPVQYLSVNWYRGGALIHTENISEDTTKPVDVYTAHLITPSRTDDGVQYTCEAELRLGPGGPQPNQSEPLNITVLYGPEIAGCPDSVSVQENRSLGSTVNCTAQGNPQPQITWLRGGQPIDISAGLSRTEGGQFTLRVTSPNGNATHTVNVAVVFGAELSGCPDRVEVMEHQTLGDSVVCTVQGSPAPETSWIKDGREVDASAPLSRTDGGLYTYRAFNTYGSTTHNVSVEVLYGPEIAGCPDSVSVQENRSLGSTVNCTAQGNPQPQITWLRGGQPIDISAGLSRTEGGQFTLRVTSPNGNATHTVNVAVVFGAELSGCRDRVEVMEHQTLGDSVVCTVQGSPAPETRWIKDGREVDASAPLSRTDGGLYTYRAFNTYGSMTHNVSVEVLSAAAFCPIEINPERVVVKYGDPVSANCTVTQTTRGMGWETSVGSIDMQTDFQSLLWNVSSLTDWTAEPKCYANFQTEPKQCVKKLDITLYKYPDSVSISSVGHTGPMEEGRQYRLQCDVQSIAPVQYLSVNWYRGGALIHTETFSENTTKPVDVSRTLLITPNRTDDGVQYSCEAELRLGPGGPQPNPIMKSEPLNITVHYKPSVTSKNQTVTAVLRGGDVILSCAAVGNPTPKLMWVNNLNEIIPNSFKDKESNITIAGASFAHAGIYTCISLNKLGEDSIIAEVKVIEDYLPVFAGIIAATVLVLLIVTLIVFSMYYKKKKTGQYNLKNGKIPTKNGNVAQNGKDTSIPMGKLYTA